MRKLATFSAAISLLTLVTACDTEPASSSVASETPPVTYSSPAPTYSSGTYQTIPSSTYGGGGSSNSYDYNVSGSDSDGNSVSGSIDVTHDGGDGTITDSDGNERNVEVEWTGRGELEGTDEEGNNYELEVD